MKKPTQVLVGVMAAVMFIAAIPAKCADIPCDSHAWDDGVIVWNEDFSEAVGVWTCSSCGETETAGAEIFPYRQEATCEEEGSVRMSANAVMGSYSCFDSRTVELEPVGHRFSEPQFDWDTDDFDCRASYVCTRDDCDETWIVDCDVTETVYPSKGHAPGGVIYTAYVNIGGTDFADTYQVEGNPIGHEYSTPMFCWSEDCRTAYIESVCSVCESEDPDKTLRADCTVRTYVENADCSSDGFTEYTASAVLLGKTWEEKKTVIIPKLEHAYTDPTFAWDDFGCQASYECTAGGETFDEACIVSEQITYTDCTSPGIVTKTAKITIGGVTYSDSVRKEIAAKNHNPVRIPGKDAACTEQGLTDGIVCADCKAILLEQTEIPALGHTEAAMEGKAPTCTEEGVSDEKYCTVCNEVLQKPMVIPATGHTAKAVPGYEPTCTEEGRGDGEVCTVCNAVLIEQIVIPALGHTPIKLDARDVTCTEDGYTEGEICDVCHAILVKQTIIYAKGHVKKTVVGYAATCTKAGLTDGVICSVCELVLTEQRVIPPKGHASKTLVGHAATCTEAGLTDGEICSECQKVLKEQTIVAAIGHVPIKQDLVPATCTKPGYTEGNTCAVCHVEFLKPGVVPPKGHTAKTIDGYDATCTEDGLSDGSICSVCEIVLAEQTVIPAVGHCPTEMKAKDATCEEAGLTNGSICTVCQTVLKEPTVIPPIGHTPTETKGCEPTCVEHGFTAGVICSVCKAVMENPEILPAMGHKWNAPVFVWIDSDNAAVAKKMCKECEIILETETVVNTAIIAENGGTVMRTTAMAVFSDGTMATDVKKTVVSTGIINPQRPSLPHADPSESGQEDKPIPEPIISQFDDIAEDSYYNDAVSWAAQQKITQGTAERIFSPDMICSRAQIVTMLWRSAGCPIIGGMTEFADVPQNSYYYKAVLWAAKTGITSGTSKTTFSPDLQCTRAQIVTMLWRTAGCPGAKTVKSFSDVAKDAWYAEAVGWAVQEGITLGTGEGVFSPDAVCTRAQIVTFLYRAQHTRTAQM